MKENLKPIQIANRIIKESGINIFENNRRQSQIEYRSLLCYLLREKLSMRWLYIVKFFNDNNKTMTHASCINIDQIDRVHYLENKCKLLENKLIECKKQYI